ILEPPNLPTGWSDEQIQPLLVGELARLLRGLGVAYRGISEWHAPYPASVFVLGAPTSGRGHGAPDSVPIFVRCRGIRIGAGIREGKKKARCGAGLETS